MARASVVIPSYNHAQYIAEAVESVLGQSFPDLELIVVDDGSTDESLDILAKFKDGRLRVIAQSNKGAHAAINRGLREATGDYLAILNSDDSYHHQRLELLIPVVEKDPDIGLVGSYIEVVDSQGKTLGVKHGFRDLEPWLLEEPERSFRREEDLRAPLLTENYWATTSNLVFSRMWFDRVGEFRMLRFAHDWDFALRMARQAHLELLPKALLRYRAHSRNTIRQDQAAMVFEICWCLAVHLPRHVSDPWFRKAGTEARIDQLLHSVYTYGCDRVLSVMLLQELAQNPESAMRLLEGEDAARARYLEYIRHQLDKRNKGKNEREPPASVELLGRVTGLIERIRNSE